MIPSLLSLLVAISLLLFFFTYFAKCLPNSPLHNLHPTCPTLCYLPTKMCDLAASFLLITPHSPCHNPFCRPSSSKKLCWKWELTLHRNTSSPNPDAHVPERRIADYKCIRSMQSKIRPDFKMLNIIKMLGALHPLPGTQKLFSYFFNSRCCSPP